MSDSTQNTIKFERLCDLCQRPVVAHPVSEFAQHNCKAPRLYGWSHMNAGLSLAIEVGCRPQSWERTVNGEYATAADL